MRHFTNLILITILSSSIFAQPKSNQTYKCSTSATSMLEEMSNDLISEYKVEKKKLGSESRVKSYAKVVTSRALLPSLDAEYMAKQIVGRYHWNSAKSKDKEAFIDAYKNLLAREYSDFLLKSSQSEEQLKFYPSRRSTPGQTVVYATIMNGKKKSTLGFYLHCVNNTMVENLPYKTWMIYDITLDNISYLDQFKVAVSSTVRNSGLPGLTKKINEISAKKD